MPANKIVTTMTATTALKGCDPKRMDDVDLESDDGRLRVVFGLLEVTRAVTSAFFQRSYTA